MKKSSGLLVGAVALLFAGAATDVRATECDKPVDPVGCFCGRELQTVATGVTIVHEQTFVVKVDEVFAAPASGLAVGDHVVPTMWHGQSQGVGQRVLLTNVEPGHASLAATPTDRHDRVTSVPFSGKFDCFTPVDVTELAMILATTRWCRGDIANAFDLSKSPPCDVGMCGAASAWSDLTLGLLAAIGLVAARRSGRTQRARP
jgi:hypothetical protein